MRRIDLLLFELRTLHHEFDALDALVMRALERLPSDCADRELANDALTTFGMKLAATTEAEWQRDDAEADAPKPARPAMSDSERYARGVLRHAVDRIERSPSVATLRAETRVLVPHVAAGKLDGRLVRAALVDAATSAGIDRDEADRIIAETARAAA